MRFKRKRKEAEDTSYWLNLSLVKDRSMVCYKDSSLFAVRLAPYTLINEMLLDMA